jgi:predicted nucleic acid-binding protein
VEQWASVSKPAVSLSSWLLDHRPGVELDLPKRRRILLSWVESMRAAYGCCMLPITKEIAERAAIMRSEARRQGRVLHIEDAMIAATALVHELTLATRNIAAFETTGVGLHNPWIAKSP